MTGRAQFTRDVRALRSLQAAGVPIFTCDLKMVQGEEVGFPKGWTTTTPADYDLRQAQQGSAFCVVTGHGVDVIDIDPRNGGDVEAVADVLLEVATPVVATVRTPSGGAHVYIPSTRLPGLKMPPGIDYLATGHMAFAPPTERPKYPGKVYRWMGIPDPVRVTSDVALARAAVLALATDQGHKRTDLTLSESGLIIEVHDVETGAALVRLSPEGQRNKRLYEVAATLAGRGFDEPSLVDALVPAAVAAGLRRAEARQTVQSGARRGLRRRRIAEAWARRAFAAIPPRSLRTPSRRDTIDALVEMFSLFGWQGVGVGCRDLAERINCSAETASRRLRDLRKAGLLERQRRDGGSYATDVFSIPERLVREIIHSAPECAALVGVDTQIQVLGVPTTSTPPIPGECQRSPGLEARRRAIRNHSAFSRVGRGIYLPPRGSDTLLAIEQGARTVHEIREATGSSPDAIRDHLRILESTGLIHRISTHPLIQIEPTWRGDVLPALDEWCDEMGIGDRPSVRRARHERQRERFRSVRQVASGSPARVSATPSQRSDSPRSLADGSASQ